MSSERVIPRGGERRALLAGWFSFEEMGATAGDLMARDVAEAWLHEAGYEVDIAHAAPFEGGIDWRAADPSRYSDVVFVCGPFGNGVPITEFLPRFQGCRLIGLDLTMLQDLEEWDPFDLLFERDSSRAAHPDLAFLSQTALVPVVGLVLIHPQPEYERRDVHERANALLREVVAARDVVVVPIDTRLDVNATGLRTAAQIESLIARMDVVLTTRLHGTVLALKNEVPVVAVDPVRGGAKIARQADSVGWPVVFGGESVTRDELEAALDYCLTPAAREAAGGCRRRAVSILEQMRRDFIAAVTEPTPA